MTFYGEGGWLRPGLPRLWPPVLGVRQVGGLGKLYRRTGKRQEALEHLATATTMYREMEMRFPPSLLKRADQVIE
jgi:hypothetical protein